MGFTDWVNDLGIGTHSTSESEIFGVAWGEWNHGQKKTRAIWQKVKVERLNSIKYK